MSFKSAVDRFANSLPGTDAYVALRQDMQALIRSETSAAAAYFLISGFAKTYVMLYEDQEVSPEFAEIGQKLMLNYLNKINAALEMHNKESLLAAMNEIIADYEQSKKIF